MDTYIDVKPSDTNHINTIYNILKSCSINLAKKFLFHWIPFYSRRAIKRDCSINRVVLVHNSELDDYTSTFQMSVNDKNLYVRKIATLPKYEGRGIGCKNLQYMEEYGRSHRCNKVCLDVYIRSKGAIDFYLRNGYIVVGTKRSIRFRELIMEKNL